MHNNDVPRLQDPRSRLFELPFVIPPGQPDVLIADNDVGTFGAFSGQALFTPGHSPVTSPITSKTRTSCSAATSSLAVPSAVWISRAAPSPTWQPAC